MSEVSSNSTDGRSRIPKLSTGQTSKVPLVSTNPRCYRNKLWTSRGVHLRKGRAVLQQWPYPHLQRFKSWDYCFVEALRTEYSGHRLVEFVLSSGNKIHQALPTADVCASASILVYYLLYSPPLIHSRSRRQECAAFPGPVVL